MNERTRRICAWGVLIVGAVFVAVGIARGEVETVLRKAVLICLECIGIG